MQTFLSETERDSLLQKVRDEWAWSDYYWHPLHPTTRKDVIAFDMDLLERELSESVLRSLLRSLGIETVLWHREHDPSEETTIDELPCIYGYGEAFIVDKTMTWIIYLSHENTVTFGGSQLVTAIKRAAPSWKALQGEGGWGSDD
jgi:hypothetical protein